MGTTNSKHRSSAGKTYGEGISIEEKLSWRDMEGPSYYCAYLGFSPLPKPPTNISVLQGPIKDLYYKYRKTPASGRSASLKLTQQGVVVVLYEDGVVKTELFFDFSTVIFVEAAKFMPVKSSSERKPKAIFVPVDESKGAVSDKNAFLVEKGYQYLISSTHPPLVVCVVRRPSGVKALDCHVFALDTTENALHIASLISSTQPASSPVAGGDLHRVKGNFDRGGRGDVIRTDHGEYSVYRGPQGYEPPPGQRFGGGPVPAPGRNGHLSHAPGVMQGPPHGVMQGPPQGIMQGLPPGAGMQGPPQGVMQGLPPGAGMQGPPQGVMQGLPQGGMPGPIILTQDIFREPPSPHQQHFGGAPGPGGYGMYEQPNFGGPSGGQFLKQPDVIMHTRQRSGDSAEQGAHDRSFSGSEHSAGGVRMRYEEVNVRNSGGNRLSGGPMPMQRNSGGPPVASRLSGGQGPPSGKSSPRPQELSPSGHISGPQQPPWQTDRMPSPASPLTSPHSPRSSGMYSPNSPRGPDPRQGGGPIFSASNLESRKLEQDDEVEEQHQGGRPVAKVPPHMKAGIKVLPSDFRMVKLKPKAEKKSDASDDSYDNNKEVMEKYRELQETERDSVFAGGMKHQTGMSSNYPDGEGFRDLSDLNRIRYHEDRPKDFMSQWNENVKEHRAKRHEDSAYRPGGQRDYLQRPEDNNNKNRYSAPPYGDDDEPRAWGSGQRSQSSYNMGGNPPADARAKDMEIADMFSNFKLQGGNHDMGMYRPPRDRNEFEEGLGYLP